MDETFNLKSILTDGEPLTGRLKDLNKFDQELQKSLDLIQSHAAAEQNNVSETDPKPAAP